MKKNNITFIAEIGMNHNGNLDLAFELIKQAKFAGADIVKFQLGWRDGPGEINNLDEKAIDQLIDWGNYHEIKILFSIISDSAFELIKNKNLNHFKIASRTVVENPGLVKKILSLKKNTYISLGMWSQKKFPFTEFNNLKYLWCLSKYPTHPKDLIGLPKEFSDENGYSGYSDHSIGIETCLLAISRGARIIEKHFTLDKSNQTIRDHTLSATPDEFVTMTTIGRDIIRKLDLGV